MADAATERAIAISTGIVGALNATGVLSESASPQAAGSQAREAALADGIVSALSAAGLLRDGTPTPGPTTTTPEPKVGDVHDVSIVQFWKVVRTKPDALVMFQFVNASRIDLGASQDPTKPHSYELKFPPNDEVYLPEFDRLLTIGTYWPPYNIQARLEITEILGNNNYGAEVTDFWVGYRS